MRSSTRASAWGRGWRADGALRGLRASSGDGARPAPAIVLLPAPAGPQAAGGRGARDHRRHLPRRHPGAHRRTLRLRGGRLPQRLRRTQPGPSVRHRPPGPRHALAGDVGLPDHGHHLRRRPSDRRAGPGGPGRARGRAGGAAAAPPPRVLSRPLLPNVSNLVVVAVTFSLGSIAGAEIALTWLGIGIQPPHPSFGVMIFDASGLTNLRAHPELMLVPAVVVAALLFAFNLLGDALNDVLSPRRREPLAGATETPSTGAL